MDRNDARQLLADHSFDGLSSAAQVAAHKAERFAGNMPTKKSQRERDKEAAIKKAKEEEEASAKAYEEFVATFGGDVEEGPSSGRRGPSRPTGKGFVRAGGGAYTPVPDPHHNQSATPEPGPPPSRGAYPPPGPSGPPTGPRAMMMGGGGGGASGASRRFAAMAQEDEEEEMPLKAGPKKKGDGANFLEQLKREQAEREERLRQRAEYDGSSVTALAAKEHGPIKMGSYDPGDPLTTNVHVSNLPANVAESSLGMFFAQFGAVGSVKIMWPRGEGVAPPGLPPVRRALGGFVAFLRRQDAERACKDLDGVEWGGNVIRTGWGKAVPLPSGPLYEIEGAGEQRDPLRSRRRRDDAERSRSPETRRWPAPGAGLERRGSPEYRKSERSRSRSPPPRAAWQTGTVFTDEGHAEVYSSDSAEDSERERLPKGRLGKLARRRFESLLRSLTSTRDKIARGMVFALEHADAAPAIVDLLVESLTVDSTPVPRKIARLHLVSDILHNASASLPNAWVYRGTLEKRLPEVFDHLGEIHRSFPGRIKAEQFRVQVSNIVDVWAEWMTFAPDVIDDLKQRLSGEHALLMAHADASPAMDERASDPRVDGIAYTSHQTEASISASSQPPPGPATAPAPPPSAVASGFKSSFKAASFAPAKLNAPLEEVVPEEVKAEEDVDGEEVFVDGEPMEEDVDGEDVDGEGIDVDGEEVVDAEEEAARARAREEREWSKESDADIFG